MKFERGNDIKDTLKIGIDEYLISEISKALSNKYDYTFILSRKTSINSALDAHRNKIAGWGVTSSGGYYVLIKVDPCHGVTVRETKYPLYYLEYDLGGFNYGFSTVEEVIENLSK